MIERTVLRTLGVCALTTVCVCCFWAGGLESVAVLRAKTRSLPQTLPTPAAVQLIGTAQTARLGSRTVKAPTVGRQYPTDVLFETAGRTAYENGSMVLTVPRLGLVVAVQAGTTDDDLNRGVGLYEVSQLPNDDAVNANVSIAGHRGAAGCEFYSIETFCPGDKIYLDYLGIRYTYLWVRNVIVEETDWSPIYCRDTASVTLTSCHPKGSHAQRICAIGELLSAAPQA